MKHVLASLAVMFVSLSVVSQECKEGALEAKSSSAVSVALCDPDSKIKAGDEVTVSAGGDTTFRVASVSPLPGGGALVSLEPTDPGSFHPFEFDKVDVTV